MGEGVGRPGRFVTQRLIRREPGGLRTMTGPEFKGSSKRPRAAVEGRLESFGWIDPGWVEGRDRAWAQTFLPGRA